MKCLSPLFRQNDQGPTGNGAKRLVTHKAILKNIFVCCAHTHQFQFGTRYILVVLFSFFFIEIQRNFMTFLISF